MRPAGSQLDDADWNRLIRYVTREAGSAESIETGDWIEADATGSRRELANELRTLWDTSTLPQLRWESQSAWQRLSEELQSSADRAAAPGRAVILFDGVCHLCNAWVRFVIARDPSSRFVFAPLESASSRELLREHDLRPGLDVGSVLVIEQGQIRDRSQAILSVVRRLRGAWKLAYALIVVPRPIRDLVYDWIASKRYRWFGRMETCPLPTPEMAGRFTRYS